MLSGALVRGRCGLDQPLDSQRYIGTLMMIIDPEAFGDIMEFKDSTTKLVRDLMAVPPVNPDEPVHVPGMRGAAAYRECVRTGMVDVDTEAWQILLAATRG